MYRLSRFRECLTTSCPNFLDDQIRLEAILVSHLLLDLRHMSVYPNGRGTPIDLPTISIKTPEANHTGISEFERGLPQEIYAATHSTRVSSLSTRGRQLEGSSSLHVSVGEEINSVGAV